MLSAYCYFLNVPSDGASRQRTCAFFLITVSPGCSRQMSSVVRRINFSPTVNSFSALAIQLVTRYDALSELAFVDLVAFDNCYCPSYFCFFCFQYAEGLSSNAGCLVSNWQISFAHLLHIRELVAIYNAERDLCILGVLVLSLKCSFLFL